MIQTTPTPADRLAHSRALLRESLLGTGPANSPASGASTGNGLDGRGTDAAVNLIAGALADRWSRHPLGIVLSLAMRAATASARPLAARHPWALLAAAFAFGGVLVWSRSWRWARPGPWVGVLAPLLLATVRAAMDPAGARTVDRTDPAGPHRASATADLPAARPSDRGSEHLND
jgi:hypothetical protein